MNRKEALLHSNLADAATGRALDRLTALAGTAAIAGVARHLGGDVDGYAVTRNGRFEVKLQLIPQVRATKYLRTTTATPAATEDVTEDIAKNVAEAFSAETTGTARATTHPIVTKLVIGCAFLASPSGPRRLPSLP